MSIDLAADSTRYISPQTKQRCQMNISTEEEYWDEGVYLALLKI